MDFEQIYQNNLKEDTPKKLPKYGRCPICGENTSWRNITQDGMCVHCKRGEKRPELQEDIEENTYSGNGAPESLAESFKKYYNESKSQIFIDQMLELIEGAAEGKTWEEIGSSKEEVIKTIKGFLKNVRFLVKEWKGEEYDVDQKESEIISLLDDLTIFGLPTIDTDEVCYLINEYYGYNVFCDEDDALSNIMWF